jgi:hypothetical protein
MESKPRRNNAILETRAAEFRRSHVLNKARLVMQLANALERLFRAGMVRLLRPNNAIRGMVLLQSMVVRKETVILEHANACGVETEYWMREKSVTRKEALVEPVEPEPVERIARAIREQHPAVFDC